MREKNKTDTLIPKVLTCVTNKKNKQNPLGVNITVGILTLLTTAAKPSAGTGTSVRVW